MTAQPEIDFTTPRLCLRRLTAADADWLFALDRDPEVVRFVDPPPPAAQSRRWLQRQADGRFGFWAAIARSTQARIGWFQFEVSNPDQPDVVELGYRLQRSAWGQGYATEGAAALIHKGFTELGCDRVVATALVANTASIRVMQKVGLRFESHWVYHSRQGEDWPAVRYALSRSEWAAGKQL